MSYLISPPSRHKEISQAELHPSYSLSTKSSDFRTKKYPAAGIFPGESPGQAHFCSLVLIPKDRRVPAPITPSSRKKMPPLPPDKSGPAKLPVAPDLDQIFNRVALAMSKSQRLFSQAQRAVANPATAGGSSSSASATARSSTTFSSRATAPELPAAAAVTTTAPRYAYKTAAQLAAEEADFEAARSLPPNAGLGSVSASGSKAAADEARKKKDDEWALRRKMGLPGARTRAGGAAGKRGRVVNDSESEEETGRTGLGRAKKARVGRRGDDDVAGREERGPGRAAEEEEEQQQQQQQGDEESERRKSGAGRGDVAGGGITVEPQAAAAEDMDQDDEQGADKAQRPAEGTTTLASDQRKKKKNKKKKKQKAGGTS